MQQKIEHAKELIRESVETYGERVAVGCSWGKDSMVLLHLALEVNPKIPVFSILTIHKPKETFQYAKMISEKYDFNPNIYMVGEKIPKELNGMNVTLLAAQEYKKEAERIKSESGREIYYEDPDLCCQLLKVVPTRHAYKDMNLQAWFSGLRKTEGHTRTFLDEKEKRSDMEIKINPILDWVENEVWRYLEDNNIPIHPWYKKKFENGKKIRSLGCAPCTVPVYDYESERAGRWKGTNKKAGECGIHTQPLRKIQKEEV